MRRVLLDIDKQFIPKIIFHLIVTLKFFYVTDYIEQKSGALGGKLVIKETRIAVDLIWEK